MGDGVGEEGGAEGGKGEGNGSHKERIASEVFAFYNVQRKK